MGQLPKYCEPCRTEFDMDSLHCPSCGHMTDVVHKCLGCWHGVGMNIGLVGGAWKDHLGKDAVEVPGKGLPVEGYLCSSCATKGVHGQPAGARSHSSSKPGKSENVRGATARKRLDALMEEARRRETP